MLEWRVPGCILFMKHLACSPVWNVPVVALSQPLTGLLVLSYNTASLGLCLLQLGASEVA